MKKRLKIAVCAAVVTVLFAGCGPKKAVINFHNLPDNEQCNYMKESCLEAEKFQHEVSNMRGDERREANNVLQALIMRCESMQELCLRTIDNAQ